MSENRDIRTVLEELEVEERAISARRRRLHDQIEFLRGGGMGEPEALERLAKLDESERQVSLQRKELQARIDALRAELGTDSPSP
jgi:chromosome segregation ATPase